MAEDSNRIGSSTGGFSGGGLLTRILGGNTSPTVITVNKPAARRGGFGPRGMRILPFGFPLDELDFSAPRGTYLDLLV